MPKIKRVGNSDFTIVENSYLRDPNLDLAERGLLVTMLSLPETWDFSGIGLTSILPCGKTKVFNTLNKLEKAGYLKRTRIYENGKVADWLYEISGTPIFLEEADEPLENTEKTQDNCAQNSEKQVSENLHTDYLLPENQEVDNQEVENQYVENQDAENQDGNKINNNKTLKNKLLNNQAYNNQSIYQSNTEHIGRGIDGTIDTRPQNPHTEKSSALFESYKTIIKQNIEYDILTNYGKSTDKEILDEIVDIMAHITAFAEKPITINGERIPAPMVQGRFMSIGQMEIEYVLESLRKNTTIIKNIRGYLISALYNSKSTQNIYWQERMQHDFYGDG